MKFFPVVNLGQIKRFEVLTDQQIISGCKAVNTFNDWEDWQDTPSGQNARRDAISALNNIIRSRPGFERGAVDEIREYCPNSDAILDYIPQPWLTGTPPVEPTGPNVASIDRYVPGPYTPPVQPNTYPAVATGQPGPGRGAFEPLEPVATGTPGPGFSPVIPEPVATGTTGTTGSEPEPEPIPPSPSQPPMMPPPVATEGAACYYVIGQGYSWGARPSGGETTGLNQKDCQAIQANYNSVRGLSVQNLETPAAQATQFTQESNQVAQAPATPGMQPAIETRPDVASTMCPQGQFWDGRQCRGSVAPGFGGGGLISQAMNLGPSGGVAAPTFGGEGFSSGGAPGAFSMAGRRRFRVVNL